jgi:transcriptional regulator with XRE-family HTH domain
MAVMTGDAAGFVGKRFGRNLAEARRRAGLSQEDVGFRAELHRTEVGMLERGIRTPRIDTLVKVAGSIGVRPGDLLAGIVWKPGTIQPGRFDEPEDGSGAAR